MNETMKSIIETARRLAGRAAETVPGRVVRKFGEDNGAGQAILIAWNALFSLFPIVLAMAALLGLALRSAGYRSTELYSMALSIVPGDPGSRSDTLKALDALQNQTGVFAIVGLAGLVWGGSSLFGAMEQAFDLIFHVKPRDFIHQKLMALGMMLVFTVLAGVAVASSVVLPFLDRIPMVPSGISHGAGVLIVQPLVGIGAGVLLFGSMYFVVPNRPQKLKEVWPGALLAGIAFYALTLLFPVYLNFNKGINHYGASFAFLFIVMNFFYFVGLITMLGVELNAVLYPVPVRQPDNAARLAPPPGGRRAEPGRVGRVAAPAAAPEAAAEPSGRSRARNALLGVVGVAIGVGAALLHRRRLA